MSFSHMILLALIALIVIPPEKLPEFARQVARIFNEFRRSTSGIWDDLKSEAMLKPEDLMKYNPPKPPPPAEPAVQPPITPVNPNETTSADKKSHE